MIPFAGDDTQGTINAFMLTMTGVENQKMTGAQGGFSEGSSVLQPSR